jgi:hypothetical protein
VKDITHFILWLFVGALVVLVVTHATGFATATTAVGGQITNDAYLLTGSASSAPASWTGKAA